MAKARYSLGFIAAASAALLVVPSLAGTNSCSREAWFVNFNEIKGDPYPLDGWERSIETDAGIACPELELQVFSGDTVKFSPPVKVVEPFAERLARFETVLAEVSLRYYRRVPRRVVNEGGYFCRAVRHRQSRLSEHAFGNAIDVVGFDFGPLEGEPPGDAGEPAPLPEGLERRFSVRVAKHWDANGDVEEYHARFLAELGAELEERDVFRTMLGPSHPTHGTHFHFDMAPYSYVNL